MVSEKVAGSHLDLVDYIIPAYHQGQIAPVPTGKAVESAADVAAAAQPGQPASASQPAAQSPTTKAKVNPDMKIDARYKCKGIRVRFHFL